MALILGIIAALLTSAVGAPALAAIIAGVGTYALIKLRQSTPAKTVLVIDNETGKVELQAPDADTRRYLRSRSKG